MFITNFSKWFTNEKPLIYISCTYYRNQYSHKIKLTLNGKYKFSTTSLRNLLSILSQTSITSYKMYVFPSN